MSSKDFEIKEDIYLILLKYFKGDVIFLNKQIIKDLKIQHFNRKEGSFNYLLDMPIRRFSKTKIKDLTQRLVKLQAELRNIQTYEPKEMWLDELKEFVAVYNI